MGNLFIPADLTNEISFETMRRLIEKLKAQRLAKQTLEQQQAAADNQPAAGDSE